MRIAAKLVKNKKTCYNQNSQETIGLKTMPIFKIKGSKLGLVKEKQIGLEKHIQKLTEENLDTIFGWEFIATEFQVNNFFIDTQGFHLLKIN